MGAVGAGEADDKTTAMVLYSDTSETVEWINMCWRKVCSCLPSSPLSSSQVCLMLADKLLELRCTLMRGMLMMILFGSRVLRLQAEMHAFLHVACLNRWAGELRYCLEKSFYFSVLVNPRNGSRTFPSLEY